MSALMVTDPALVAALEALDASIFEAYSATQRRLWPDRPAEFIANAAGYALFDAAGLETRARPWRAEALESLDDATLAEVEALIAWLASRRAAHPEAAHAFGPPGVRVILGPGAPDALTRRLAELGFRFASTSLVLTRRLEASAPQPRGDVAPAGARDVEAGASSRGELRGPEDDARAVDIIEVTRESSPALRARVAALIPRGFMNGEAPGASELDVSRTYVESPGATHLIAQRDGVDLGGCALLVRGDMALLTGMSVLPEHRGQGVQRALIARRLQIARAQGARVAALTAAPGNTSQRNAERAGFTTRYARVSLVAPGCDAAGGTRV